jgi:hypothetical protein
MISHVNSRLLKYRKRKKNTFSERRGGKVKVSETENRKRRKMREEEILMHLCKPATTTSAGRLPVDAGSHPRRILWLMQTLPVKLAPHRGGPGSSPGLVMWDLW